MNPTLIPVTSLQTQQQPVNIPPAPPVDTGAAANVSIPTPQQLVDQSTAPTGTDQQQSNILNRVASLVGDQKSLATLQSQEAAKAGLGAQQKTLNDLASQVEGLNNESLTLQNDAAYTIPNQAQVDATGRGITSAGLAPITASQLRMNQIKQGALATRALSLKSAYYAAAGNYNLAKDAADRAAQVQFDASDQEIKHQQALLAVIAPQLDKEQKARATLLQAQLADRTQQIGFQREDFKVGQGLAIAAMKFNPNDPTAQFNAQQALKLDPKDPQYLPKLMQLVGKYQQDPIAVQKAVDEHLQSRQQIAQSAAQTRLVNAQADKTSKEMQLLGMPSAKVLSVTESQALGVPYGTTEAQAQAMGKTPQKAPTAAQETTALYANRIEQSNTILSQLDNYAMKANPVGFGLQKNLPDVANVLKSGNFQSLEQAQRNFVNAVLRRESGAVISPNEFINAGKQYFAQPGDTPATVAQKKANRDLVQQGFISGAGGAYTPLISAGDKPTTTKSGKPFDVAGAKAQGYSDQEISDYLAKH